MDTMGTQPVPLIEVKTADLRSKLESIQLKLTADRDTLREVQAGLSGQPKQKVRTRLETRRDVLMKAIEQGDREAAQIEEELHRRGMARENTPVVETSLGAVDAEAAAIAAWEEQQAKDDARTAAIMAEKAGESEEARRERAELIVRLALAHAAGEHTEVWTSCYTCLQERTEVESLEDETSALVAQVVANQQARADDESRVGDDGQADGYDPLAGVGQDWKDEESTEVPRTATSPGNGLPAHCFGCKKAWTAKSRPVYGNDNEVYHETCARDGQTDGTPGPGVKLTDGKIARPDGFDAPPPPVVQRTRAAGPTAAQRSSETAELREMVRELTETVKALIGVAQARGLLPASLPEAPAPVPNGTVPEGEAPPSNVTPIRGGEEEGAPPAE